MARYGEDGVERPGKRLTEPVNESDEAGRPIRPGELEEEARGEKHLEHRDQVPPAVDQLANRKPSSEARLASRARRGAFAGRLGHSVESPGLLSREKRIGSFELAVDLIGAR